MRAAPLVLVLLLVLPALPADAAEDASPAARALWWLGQQPAPGAGLAPYYVEAGASAGEDPARWPRAEESALSRLAEYANPDGEIYYSHLRVAHAAGIAGHDPRTLQGADWIARVRAGYSGGQSGDPTYVNDDIWAILALRAAGVPRDDEQVRASVLAVKAAQRPDGSWAYYIHSTRGSVDVTAMALAALRAAGEDMRAYSSAKVFLDAWRDADGGFYDGPPARLTEARVPNCQSTAWAIHGYAALGLPPPTGALVFLRSLQTDEGGLRTSHGTDPRYPPPADIFCTVEALVVLAGARYPLPSYAPLEAPRPTGHAAEPLRLPVPAGFERAVWTIGEERVRGGTTISFPTAGDHAYSLVAESATQRARATGVVTVLSARPVVGTLPEDVTLHRHTPLALDLARAYDPDGAVVAFEVDWGDGNVTDSATHAYALPGGYNISVRARDDAGVWSHPARMRVDVVNRAPVLAPLPERVLGDRVRGAALDVQASDPDGDALEGVGARTLLREVLGNHSIEIVVSDGFGGAARANVTLEVVNLPPRVSLRLPPRALAGEPVTLEAEATDEDGPAPTLAWSTGGAVAVFEPGAHLVRVIATDADGATAEASRTILVEDAGAADVGPSPADPPEVRALEATLAQGTLQIAFDADGAVTLRWRSDVGKGDVAATTSPTLVPLAGATWASVELVAERDGLTASRETGLLVAPTERAPPTNTEAPGPAPSPVVVAARAEPASEPEPEPEPVSEPEPEPDVKQPEESTLVPSGVRSELPRQTPAPAWIVALALALAATRRRRAA